ncbi:MAG: flagellar protein FlgN [Fimbriimonadales bacterium]|nr:flagellar protein FlgN [Fimbriimonadales bacterium]
MKTRKLQEIWREWIASAERLLKVLHEQTAAIMLRKVEEVERLQPHLELLIDDLRAIDARAVEAAHELTTELGVPHNFYSLVKALQGEEQMQVQSLANKVRAIAQDVQRVMRKNQTLIENELAFIAGSLHLLAKAGEEQQGPFGPKTHAAVLFDERA